MDSNTNPKPITKITKAQLQEYGKIKTELKQIERWIRKLESDVYGIKARTFSGMPKCGNYRAPDVSANIDKLNNLINYYQQRRDELIDKQLSTEQAIEEYPSFERALLRARYIDCMLWEEAADDLYYSSRQVYRLHKKIVSLF